MNLAFSSIGREDREKVIDLCYEPLLDVAESGIPLGIECSGWTLDEIERWRPAWIRRFADLLKRGACQLIGSGYVQLISPLVPWRTNEWNLKLGMDCYKRLLGVGPELILVNEMAYTPSMLPLYQRFGALGIVMERNNFETQTGTPVTAETQLEGPQGTRLPVLWADSILFQKFQRYIHRDIHEAEYHEHLEQSKLRNEPLPLYCSDAEIFDYRPGRYHYEHTGEGDEWQRIQQLFHGLKKEFNFLLPGAALVLDKGKAPTVKTPDTRDPLPVKKQPKYNIARWAVTGRDDLKLNTLCFRLAGNLNEDPLLWQGLCESWSSDLRTHIGDARFHEAQEILQKRLEERGLNSDFSPAPPSGSAIWPEGLRDKGFEIQRDAIHLTLKTEHLSLTINTRRGLAIKHLAFASHGFQPVVGTLPHGYFHNIRLGADFYSGGLIIELPGDLKRVTDLERMEPQFFFNNGLLTIRGELKTCLGTFIKTLFFRGDEQKMGIRYDFPHWERPFGTVRVGNITLIPEAFDGERLKTRSHNGGKDLVEFDVKPCNHGAAVSSLISCSAGFGATEGFLELGDEKRGIVLEWDPASCAAFPMLVHQPAAPSHFTRLSFSLAELDDTRKRGGAMPPLQFSLSPRGAAHDV